MPNPARHVRQRLAFARAAGAPFGDAWRAALDALPAQRRRYGQVEEAHDWRVALDAARPAFERAYAREPATRAERAAAVLAAALVDP